MKLTALLLSAVIGIAAAGCPNLCSGHGTCGGRDVCTCYANWQGADCSLRTCASGNAWALDNADPHGYDECSGGGLCDRSSGECKCFAGFTGFACQRRQCPNECSQHGQCRLLSEIQTIVPYSPTSWDAKLLQACVCDPGYFGTDCSQRRCPTGDDPLTTCTSNSASIQEIRVTLGSAIKATLTAGVIVTPSAYTNNDVQMDQFGTGVFAGTAVKITDLQTAESSAQMRVGAIDASGQTYYAPTSWKTVFSPQVTVNVAVDNGATALEMALENIAGFKVRNVKVAAQFTNAATANGFDNILQKRFLVTFVPDLTNSANVGAQNPLVCQSGYGCNSPGCQPIVKMPFLYRYAATVEKRAVLDASDSVVTTPSFRFYTGDANTDTDFNAKKFVRLDTTSMPTMPTGVAIDAQMRADDLARYDIRVVVAVQAATTTQSPSGTDVYWTKVVYGHSNIMADATEYSNSSTSRGPFFAGLTTNFVGTLLGFTYRGFIPASKIASIPDAPGVILSFPAVDMIDTTGSNSADQSKYMFFEVLIKMPSCTVTQLLTGSEFKDTSGVALSPVDQYTENIECSNRGQCNRETGMCQCYDGYTGLACHKQTVLV